MQIWFILHVLAVMHLATQAPIIAGIYRVIHEGADPAKTVEEVMSRELRPEVDAEMFEAASRNAA